MSFRAPIISIIIAIASIGAPAQAGDLDKLLPAAVTATDKAVAAPSFSDLHLAAYNAAAAVAAAEAPLADLKAELDAAAAALVEPEKQLKELTAQSDAAIAAVAVLEKANVPIAAETADAIKAMTIQIMTDTAALAELTATWTTAETAYDDAVAVHREAVAVHQDSLFALQAAMTSPYRVVIAKQAKEITALQNAIESWPTASAPATFNVANLVSRPVGDRK